ncbi:MAG: tetratricopeptide repeat protein [bacterium]
MATQQDMVQLESQMDDLNSTIGNMQKNQADLAVKMDTLSSSLVSFSESLKDFGNQVTRLSSRLDDIGTALGQKVTALGQTIKKQQEEAEASLLPSKIYNDSYLNLTRKNYDLAAQGFRLYLEKFSQGEMAENAWYNLGEACYAGSRWQDAAVAYASVLDKFPQSRQTASARLKYALSLLKLPGSHRDEAERYLKSVIQDFPKSGQARLAKEQLKRLMPDSKPHASKTPVKQTSTKKKSTPTVKPR